MNKKQKENIKRVVGEGLQHVLSKLKISKPSAKMERMLKKHSKKLVDQFKAEVKRLGKKKNKRAAMPMSKKSKARTPRSKKQRTVIK
jgi:chemotaxis response regulator CheB